MVVSSVSSIRCAGEIQAWRKTDFEDLDQESKRLVGQSLAGIERLEEGFRGVHRIELVQDEQVRDVASRR
jgi:hypothetical protein